MRIDTRRNNTRSTGIAVGIFALLLILIGTAGCGRSAATGSSSPTATTTTAAPVRSVAAIITVPKPTAKVQPKAAVKPTVTVKPTATATVKAKPKATPAPPPAPSVSAAPAGCHPLSNEGTCYRPGEYCRDSDHGVHGVAGNGEAIVCEDNDGWRWEPA